MRHASLAPKPFHTISREVLCKQQTVFSGRPGASCCSCGPCRLSMCHMGLCVKGRASQIGSLRWKRQLLYQCLHRGRANGRLDARRESHVKFRQILKENQNWIWRFLATSSQRVTSMVHRIRFPDATMILRSGKRGWVRTVSSRKAVEWMW